MNAEYKNIKDEITNTINHIEAESPEAGQYLREHLIMDDVNETFKYTGDDRIKIDSIF